MTAGVGDHPRQDMIYFTRCLLENPREPLTIINPSLSIWSAKRRRTMEKALREGGIPPRRGRRTERRAHPTAEEQRQRRADSEKLQDLAYRRRWGRPRPPTSASRSARRPKRRTAMHYLGRPSRVLAIVRCALPSCGKVHHQRRPPFQVGRPGQLGVGELLPPWVGYCCPAHRMRAAYERRRQGVPTWTPCGAPGCGKPVEQRLRGMMPAPGRPRDFCDRRCQRRAYRSAHPSAPATFYPDLCRSCGGRIDSTGRPGRPPVLCADCSWLADLEKVMETRRRHRAAADPEYADWLRRNPGKR